MMLLATLLLGNAVVSGQYVVSSQQVVSNNARQLTGTASSIQGALNRQFRQSAVYGQLRAKMTQIRTRALQLQTLARLNSSRQQIYQQTSQIDCLLQDFQALVATARYRSDFELDRPLAGCTLHIDQKVQWMLDSLDCVYDELSANAGNTVNIQIQQVQVYGQTDYRYQNQYSNGFQRTSRYVNPHRNRNRSFYKR